MMFYPLETVTSFDIRFIEKEFPEEGTPFKVYPSSGTF
jgi:hypothetical protein